MFIPSETISKTMRISRRIGWVLIILHSLIAIIVAASFGNRGSEWWPVIFFAIDFPISIPIIKFSHSLTNWPLWVVFLCLGNAWHFLWPQGLAIFILKLRYHL